MKGDGPRDTLVVTGMGALGAGVATPADLFAAAVAGRSPGEWLELPGLERPMAVSRAPDPTLDGELHASRRLDRSAVLAATVARDAIAQANLVGSVDSDRIGVSMGSSRGPIGRVVAVGEAFRDGDVPATAAVETGTLSLAGAVGQAYGLKGPTSVVSATCTSAAVAVAMGALHILAGDADAMIVGGSEAPLVPEVAAQMIAARVTGWDEDPARTCKPFDSARNGLMLGEGAAALVIERESAAAARGAVPLARLAGWAHGGDTGGRSGLTADGEGLARAVKRAIERSGLEQSEIGYVNAHGTATRLNDPVEVRALQSVFGKDGVPPVSSTKPITGHCLGATAALEAVIAIETLRNGCLPPTANHVDLDPDCPLDVIAGDAREASPRAVLSTSLGFWGVQAALVFEAV